MRGYGQITISSVNDGKPGIPGTPALNIIVGNESQTIPCKNDGLVSDNILIEIPFSAYEGFNRIPCIARVGVLPNGMTVGSITDATTDTDGKIILNVAKSATLGNANTLTGKVVLTFIANEKSFAKNFTWAKSKDGATGSARIFILEPSTLIIKREQNKTLTPNTVTFNSFYRDGNKTSTTPYSGRFIIQESINGVSFTNKYVSTKDENTVTYTPTSFNVSAIKCILHASGGITDELDSQTVTILSNGTDLEIGARNYIIKSDVWETDTSTSSGITQSIEDGVLKIISTTGNENWNSFTRKNVIEDNFQTDDTFTFAIEIKSDDSTIPPSIYFKRDMGYYPMIGKVSDTYTWCYYTGKWNDAEKLAFHFGWSKSIGTYYIRKIMFIRGNKLLDWTPAPEDIEDAFTEIKTEISGVSSKVDAVEKSITNKVWQSDIIEKINNYDKTTIKEIRDQQTEQKIEIGKISSFVSDVESKLETKADGSTVQELTEKVAKVEQDAEGFKQTVKKTYVSKSDKLGSRNLLRNSKTLIFDNYNFTNDSSTYLTDEIGNFLIDENNNFLIEE